MCARTPSKAEAAIASIKQQHPKANIKSIQLDLSSLESTRTAAQQIMNDTDRLDVLILNAGIAATPPALTKDGYESQFGTNHLGHASFTQNLLPLLLRTSQAPSSDVRITIVSSAAHQFYFPATLSLPLAKTTMSTLSSQTRYAHSKLCNILFAKSLSQHYPSITTTSLHPGLVKTDLPGRMQVGFPLSLIVKATVWVTGVSVEEGAKCQLWASTAREVRSGEYYEPVGKRGKVNRLAGDEGAGKELWGWTEGELRKWGGEWVKGV